jgi:hypothetical protein
MTRRRRSKNPNKSSTRFLPWKPGFYGRKQKPGFQGRNRVDGVSICARKNPRRNGAGANEGFTGDAERPGRDRSYSCRALLAKPGRGSIAPGLFWRFGVAAPGSRSRALFRYARFADPGPRRAQLGRRAEPLLFQPRFRFDSSWSSGRAHLSEQSPCQRGR